VKLGDTEINFTFYSGLSVPPKAEDGSEWFGVLAIGHLSAFGGQIWQSYHPHQPDILFY